MKVGNTRSRWPKRDIMREERLEETICESLQASGWIYEPGMKDTGWDERLCLFPVSWYHSRGLTGESPEAKSGFAG